MEPHSLLICPSNTLPGWAELYFLRLWLFLEQLVCFLLSFQMKLMHWVEGSEYLKQGGTKRKEGCRPRCLPIMASNFHSFEKHISALESLGGHILNGCFNCLSESIYGAANFLMLSVGHDRCYWVLEDWITLKYLFFYHFIPSIYQFYTGVHFADIKITRT